MIQLDHFACAATERGLVVAMLAACALGFVVGWAITSLANELRRPPWWGGADEEHQQ